VEVVLRSGLNIEKKDTSKSKQNLKPLECRKRRASKSTNGQRARERPATLKIKKKIDTDSLLNYY